MPVKPGAARRVEVDGDDITVSELKKRYTRLQKELSDLKSKHFCIMCGKRRNPEVFYKARNSHYDHELHHICKDCLFSIIEPPDSKGRKTQPTKESLIRGLCYANKPFYTSLYKECIEQVERNPARTTNFARVYISTIMGVNYEGKTFDDSDILSAQEITILDQKEFDINQKQQLYRDIKDVVDIVGYDPFEKENEEDKPFLYSQLLSYVDTDDDSDQDVYKMQCCISITRDFLKIKKLDNMLSEKLNDPNTWNSKNMKTVNEMSTTKNNIMNSINKTASENNISSKGNRGAAKEAKTFTGLIKSMKEMNLRDSEVNGFDIMTCKGMQQVLDLSHQSIMKQLKLEDNEYAEMVAEQREMVVKANQDRDLYQELFRIILRENLDLKKTLSENGVSLGDDLMDINDLISDLKEQIAEKFSGDSTVPKS